MPQATTHSTSYPCLLQLCLLVGNAFDILLHREFSHDLPCASCEKGLDIIPFLGQVAVVVME